MKHKNKFHYRKIIFIGSSVKTVLNSFFILIFSSTIYCQDTTHVDHSNKSYYLLNPYRLVPNINSQNNKYVDLDNDGDPDVLDSFSENNIPILWIDDDDDMREGDLQGDTDSDCLMVDLNKDGEYGSYSDVVIDWVDNDNDNIADMQIYLEYVEEANKDKPWGPGHLMISMDLDKDNIMNYIDWNTFKLRGWVHDGQGDFYEDYHGKNLFLKIHTSPEKMNDLRLNWENPFLFYDPDNDGLTEYAIRLLDIPVRGEKGDEYLTRLTGNISWVSMSYDLDNDNGIGNEMDYDLTLSFRGEGFNYMDQKHSFPNLRGLPESDKYFMDSRVRKLDELIYPDHETALDLIYNRGNWNEVYFIYDEDDDCNRWERVELYDPLDPYITGKNNGGLDDNPQADVVGNRGEWDLDNSGEGNLYVSDFDGRIHLYGAELGYWRIDQNAYYYHGMGGLYDGYGPERLSNEVENLFPVVKYIDSDNNGFIDEIEYDLDGDKNIDQKFSLIELGISDRSEIIKSADMDYQNYKDLQSAVSNNMWENALDAIAVAKDINMDLSWYALLMHPKSIEQKYKYGYWLQFYLFQDFMELYKRTGRENVTVAKAYFGKNWKSLIQKRN
ncbi:MAG TPA: hypothetical protein ENH87_12455 [Pricia antarctica]|uniref:Uncharacterized protein n=2 Tax=root TaxID=1 RepID=A0A831QR07_9FLAO|nr:hypothetical protein [Pricia antarctica]